MSAHLATHPRAIQSYCRMLWEARKLGFPASHHSQTYANSSNEVDVAFIPLRRGYPRALVGLVKEP